MKKTIIKLSNNDVEKSNNHWEYCTKNNIPFISISDDGNHSVISYDILPCRPIFKDEEGLFNAISSMYMVYANKYNFVNYLLIGGTSAAGFHVYKKDAKLLANLLYDFIMQYIETTKYD